MSFVEVTVEGRRKKGILDKKGIRNKNLQSRRSWCLHEGESGSVDQPAGVERERAGRKSASAGQFLAKGWCGHR